MCQCLGTSLLNKKIEMHAFSVRNTTTSLTTKYTGHMRNSEGKEKKKNCVKKKSGNTANY